jgi:hypothetical protein
MRPRIGCFLDLSERQEQCHHPQRNQQDHSRKQSGKFMSGFHGQFASRCFIRPSDV